VSAHLAIGAAAVLAAATLLPSQGSRSISIEELKRLAAARRGSQGGEGRPMPEEPGPLRIIGYVDFFKRNEAPYVMEERISESGRAYEVKVYLPEAYTEDYMVRSDETGRLVRWGVELSDRRTVSRDGAFRVRFPEQWAKIKAAAARKRGEKRDEYLAQAIWREMSPDEQSAMIASVDLDAYADGRGIQVARKDLQSDLKESGSLLFWVDIPWFDLLSDIYAKRHLGGPVGSTAWSSSTFEGFARYRLERDGQKEPESLKPDDLPLLDKRWPESLKLHPVWAMSMEYWGNKPMGARVAEQPRVMKVLRERMGPALAAIVDEEAAHVLDPTRGPTRRDQILQRYSLAMIRGGGGGDDRNKKLDELYRPAIAGMDPRWAKELAGWGRKAIERVIELFVTISVKYKSRDRGL
jgi:hypothetical protein